MDALTSAGLGARRNEDIALDLLKFVAATAGVGRPAAPSTGFSGASAPKPEEHVTQLLDLYSRCLKAVEGEGPAAGAAEIAGEPNLRVAVAGAGAFGRNHLRVYRELETPAWVSPWWRPSSRTPPAPPKPQPDTLFLCFRRWTSCWQPT